MITSSAASPPGHAALAPSAPQNIPNDVSITPTPNFIAFSGTRERRVHEEAGGDDDRMATAAAAAASPMLCWLAPNVSTMNDDLESFEQDALERDRERVAVESGDGAGRPRGRRGLFLERFELVVERLEAGARKHRLA